MFFRKNYLLMAQEYYERHGGKTIILAKFMPDHPDVRPGGRRGRADAYRRFLAYSVVGAVGWITSMILLGYTLTCGSTRCLKPIFGRNIQVAKHIDKVIIVVDRWCRCMPIAWKAWKG